MLIATALNYYSMNLSRSVICTMRLTAPSHNGIMERLQSGGDVGEDDVIPRSLGSVGSERGRNLIEGAISGISVPMTVVQDKLGGAKFQQHKRCSS